MEVSFVYTVVELVLLIKEKGTRQTAAWNIALHESIDDIVNK
jgi:hypothetical protein